MIMELYKITTPIVLMMVLLEFRVSAFDMNNYLKYEELISRIPPGYMPFFRRKFKQNKMGDNCYTVTSPPGRRNIPDIAVKTVEECVLYCWLKLMPVGLIKFGGSCMCTEYRCIKKTKSVMCHRRCKDNMRQNCGGERGFAGYFTGYAWYPEEGIKTRGVLYFYSKRYYKGCYNVRPQQIGQRLKFGTVRMTVDLCCSSCFKFYNYRYAAVQNGAYCTCFNDLKNVVKENKVWLCGDVDCVGDSNPTHKQKCGGKKSEARVYKEDKLVSSAGPSHKRLPPDSTFLTPYIRPKGCYDSFDGTKDRVNKDPVCNSKALPVPVARARLRAQFGGKPLPPPIPMIINPNPARLPVLKGAVNPNKGSLGNTINAYKIKLGPLTDNKIYGISGGVIGVLILVYCCCRSCKKADEEQKEKEEQDKEDREERKRKKKAKKEKKKREQEEAANQFYQEENYYY